MRTDCSLCFKIFEERELDEKERCATCAAEQDVLNDPEVDNKAAYEECVPGIGCQDDE